MDLIFYIIVGACVGSAVGLTGVGGGSLMTPLLILWGVPEKIAIGTDLLYAAATKTGAMYSHHRQGNVRWNLVLWLAAGSIPASLLTSLALSYLIPPNLDYGPLLTTTLGIMLIVTAFVVLFRHKLQGKYKAEPQRSHWVHRHSKPVSLAAGIALGILVTLSSVGAGAFCAALLMMLYPNMPSIKVVGTDIGHAVPLTLVAGMGHMWNNNIDYQLLAGLLLGSLPAVHYSSKLASRVPNSLLQPILASLLLIIGVKFTLF